MKRILTVLTMIVLVAGLAGLIRAEEKSVAKKIFVCDDAANPCVADTPEGCAGCSAAPVEKSLALETLMKTLGALAKVMKADVEKPVAETLAKRSAIVAYITGRAAEMTPPQNADKIEGYKTLCKVLADQAAAMSAAVAKNDAEGLKKSFAEFGKSCGDCHRQYRKS